MMEEALLIEAVADWATRSEKVSWNRKRKNIEAIIENHVRPLEDKILELNSKLQVYHDKITLIRKEMVTTCIHPVDYLVAKRDAKTQDLYVLCKFCNRELMPKHATKDVQV